MLKQQFNTLLEHDRAMFDEPSGWRNKTLTESPLINNFYSVWSNIKGLYQSELSALAYRSIPDEEGVAQTFVQLTKLIR